MGNPGVVSDIRDIISGHKEECRESFEDNNVNEFGLARLGGSFFPNRLQEADENDGRCADLPGYANEALSPG